MYLGFPCRTSPPSCPFRSGNQSYQWSIGRDNSACGLPGPGCGSGTWWCCSLGWKAELLSWTQQTKCCSSSIFLRYLTFLCVDSKARFLTENAHIHHSHLHVWNHRDDIAANHERLRVHILFSVKWRYNIPLKNMASPSGYPLGGGTLLSMYPRIALVILSKAFVPYCREERQSDMKHSGYLKQIYSHI